MKVSKIAVAAAVVACLIAALGGVGAAANAAAQNSADERPGPVTVLQSEKEYGEKVVEVDIKNFQFQPSGITVEPGTTVVWTNYDGVRHNVRMLAEKDLNSLEKDVVAPLLSAYETFAVTFNEVGQYTYHCDPHPFMIGRVVVKKVVIPTD